VYSLGRNNGAYMMHLYDALVFSWEAVILYMYRKYEKSMSTCTLLGGTMEHT